MCRSDNLCTLVLQREVHEQMGTQRAGTAAQSGAAPSLRCPGLRMAAVQAEFKVPSNPTVLWFCGSGSCLGFPAQAGAAGVQRSQAWGAPFCLDENSRPRGGWKKNGEENNNNIKKNRSSVGEIQAKNTGLTLSCDIHEFQRTMQ